VSIVKFTFIKKKSTYLKTDIVIPYVHPDPYPLFFKLYIIIALPRESLHFEGKQNSQYL